MIAKLSNPFINPRLMAVFFLGFVSGLPLMLTNSTLQAWFTEANINLFTIGSLSLLGLPYSLKFLWAPLMDHYRFPRFGTRKVWILGAQSGVILMICWLATMQPASQAPLMAGIALTLAFFSASADIAINAYQTDVLEPKERGLGASYNIFAYRIATLLSGGFALVMADYLGWKLTYECMAVILLAMMMPVYWAPRLQEEPKPPGHLYETTLASLKNLLAREHMLLILLFIVLYKSGDALVVSLMTNFLLHGLGFSLTEVGLAYKLVSFVATVLGAFFGGVILTRWNIYRALLLFGVMQAFSNLSFAILASVGKNFTLMTSSIFIENFCSGLSTAALLAFMMSLCNHRYTASQFALLSAVASLGRVFLGPVASLMVESIGWVQFYIWASIICLPGLICLMLLKEKVLYHVQYAQTD